jgi:hypothetical protein
VLGEEDIVVPFEHEIGRLVRPFVTVSATALGFNEHLLRGAHNKIRRALWEALKESKQVHVPTFAKHHAQRSQEKVWRALQTLVQLKPQLKPHLVGQPGDKYIYVVDKPAPL